MLLARRLSLELWGFWDSGEGLRLRVCSLGLRVSGFGLP